MQQRRLPRLAGLVLGFVGLLSLTTGAGARTIEDCVIEPNRIAEVSSSVDGVIDTIDVKRGDLVKKNQPLAKLKSRVEMATVELARIRSERDQAIKARRARLEFTQRQLKRNQDLLTQNLISEQIVDESETDVLLAELELGEFIEERQIAIIELERAQEALDIRTIRSPFSGVVIDVLAAPGESVENRPLVRIASINPLNVEVIAPVELFGKIKKGMQGTVVPEDPIGGKYTARVAIVDRVLDAASGTFGIRLQLKNNKYRLPAGLRCNVTFDALKTSSTDSGGSGPATADSAPPAAAGAVEKQEQNEPSYTVYLFSTRSENVAGQVNNRFREEGHDTEILTSEKDSVTRYRIAVRGFPDKRSAEDYSSSVSNTLGINQAWIAKTSD